MKKYVLLILFSIMVIGLTGCSFSFDISTDKDKSIMEEENVADDLGLTLSVKSASSTEVTLVFNQNGLDVDGYLQTGSDYVLKIFKDNEWKEVPTIIKEYAWDAMAYNISENDETEFKYNWEWLYGKLEAGKYKIEKTVMDFVEPGNYSKNLYSAEFEITE